GRPFCSELRDVELRGLGSSGVTFGMSPPPQIAREIDRLWRRAKRFRAPVTSRAATIGREGSRYPKQGIACALRTCSQNSDTEPPQRRHRHETNARLPPHSTGW